MGIGDKIGEKVCEKCGTTLTIKSWGGGGNVPHGPDGKVHGRDECRVATLEARLRAAMNDRGAAHLALRVAENAILAAQGEGDPDPEHGHAPMGLFELGLNAGERTIPEECPFVADAERLSDVLKAALAAIRAALPAKEGGGA
jgi:hypothetical protein